MIPRLWWLRLSAPVVGRLPAVFYPLAAVAGWVAWHTRPTARRNLVRNLLPICDGERQRARREGQRAYRNVARYWVDLCTLPHRDMSRFERDHMDVVHSERLVVLESGEPLVAVSAHTGNPELAIQALTYRGRPFIALVEPLQPPALGRLMVRLRSSAGGDFHEANLAGLRACVEALHDNGCVGLMADRDIQGTGLCVQLAGRPVRLPRGPWELARRCRATILPVFVARNWRDHFRVYVEEPFRVPVTDDQECDVRQAVEHWAALFEAHLRREPGQWFVLEDFWKVHRCGEG